MNYYRKIIGDNFSGDFLRKVLLQVNTDLPFRGLSLYHNGNYSYILEINGDLSSSNGYEKIFYDNHEIYLEYINDGIVD